MNLNPIPYLRNVRAAMRAASGRKFDNAGGDIALAVRMNDPMGPWSDALGAFEARKVNPHIYEALREALPILDGAIGALVTLDGILRVEGDNDAIVAEIEDWISNVPVNDAEKGLQAMYESQGNERYEQGLGVAEWVTDKKGTDIVGLRVADSKGIHFRRDATGLQVYYRPPATQQDTGSGLGNVEALLRGGGTSGAAIDIGKLVGLGYKPLNRSRLLYTVNQPDADDPYGTSVLRSLEFNGQTLLTIQNAMARVWSRYGDPPLLVVYKVANRKVIDTPGELDKRRDAIAANLKALLEQKGRGNSADLVQAIGKDDDFTIEVIGAEGTALEIEMPARHLLEQIVSKVGLPPWMLGLQFSTSERMAEQQSGMALQGAKTRWERRKPGLTHLVATMLRLRGRTWKRGDWRLVQELPNIQDQLKAAQAGFLRAQTAMMGGDTGAEVDPTRGIDNNLRASRGRPRRKHVHKADGSENDEPDAFGEPWAEEDPLLPKIERQATGKLSKLWAALGVAVLLSLRLRDQDIGEDEVWNFDMAAVPALLSAGDVFLAGAGGDESPVVAAMLGAWERGLANAAADLGAPGAVLTLSEGVVAQLRAHGLAQVRTTFARTYRDQIVNTLISGVYNGLAPAAVAQILRRVFDRTYDWDRLVASEMTDAHSAAKELQFAANGLEKYDWSTAGDGDVCPICSNHRDSGPYTVGAGPLPGKDSHPLCRCSIIPAL